MKTMLILAAISLSGFAAQAQSTDARNLKGFNRIEVQNGIELVYTQGERESVMVECLNPQHLSYVETQQKGKTLSIRMKNSFMEENTGSTRVKVYVTDNDLEAINAESGAMITFDGQVNAQDLSIELTTGATLSGSINATGTCSLKVKQGAGFKGNVITGRLRADVISGGFVTMAGHADQAQVFCSGGTLNAPKFTAEKASVNARRLSAVALNVKNRIMASSDSSSAITYSGQPEKIRLAEHTFAVARD